MQSYTWTSARTGARMHRRPGCRGKPTTEPPLAAASSRLKVPPLSSLIKLLPLGSLGALAPLVAVASVALPLSLARASPRELSWRPTSSTAVGSPAPCA